MTATAKTTAINMQSQAIMTYHDPPEFEVYKDFNNSEVSYCRRKRTNQSKTEMNSRTTSPSTRKNLANIAPTMTTLSPTTILALLLFPPSGTTSHATWLAYPSEGKPVCDEELWEKPMENRFDNCYSRHFLIFRGCTRKKCRRWGGWTLKLATRR